MKLNEKSSPDVAILEAAEEEIGQQLSVDPLPEEVVLDCTPDQKDLLLSTLKDAGSGSIIAEVINAIQISTGAQIILPRSLAIRFANEIKSLFQPFRMMAKKKAGALIERLKFIERINSVLLLKLIFDQLSDTENNPEGVCILPDNELMQFGDMIMQSLDAKENDGNPRIQTVAKTFTEPGRLHKLQFHEQEGIQTRTAQLTPYVQQLIKEFPQYAFFIATILQDIQGAATAENSNEYEAKQIWIIRFGPDVAQLFCEEIVETFQRIQRAR